MDQPTFTTPNFGSSFPEYIKNVKLELSKVDWPNKDQIVKATILVVIVSIVVGGILGSLDYLFTNLFTIALK